MRKLESNKGVHMPDIKSVLERADQLCTHGSSNYKRQQLIASNYHKLFALAQVTDGDMGMLRARMLLNIKAQQKMTSPYRLHDFFTRTKSDFMTKSLAKSFSREDVGYIEVFIAESLVCQQSEDEWMKKIYMDHITKDDLKGVPDIFYTDIYLNGIRSLIYGYGNCGLRTDALLVELIRADSFDEIHMLHLNPKDGDDRPLEELYFIAVGDWPKPGCQIIVPWFEKKRVFEWTGDISVLKEGLEEPTLDPKKSTIETIFSINKANIGPIKGLVDATYESYLAYKPSKFKAIRDLYCLFLENALDYKPPTQFKAGLSGPYYYAFQRGFFSGLEAKKTIEKPAESLSLSAATI